MPSHLDETTDFASILEGRSAPYNLDLGKVSHINSVGVKHWVEFFGRFAPNSINLLNCPPVIVDQMNLIASFFAGMKITSVAAPFRCSVCSAEESIEIQVSGLGSLEVQVPQGQCLKCNGPLEFDDYPEEYFHFLDYVKLQNAR
ncbi:MAG: hypothetical protein EOO38_05315 [Cytophagaceae bacterium]|nr:MAG: hypothetical protein EOO38_05315 [Cytophagaceae bacterium]